MTLRVVEKVCALSVETRSNEYQPLATKRSFIQAILRRSCQLSTPTPADLSSQFTRLVEVSTLAVPLDPTHPTMA